MRIREGKNTDPGSATLGFNRSALPCRGLVEEKAASSQATAHRLHTVSSTTIASLGTIPSHHGSAPPSWVLLGSAFFISLRFRIWHFRTMVLIPGTDLDHLCFLKLKNIGTYVNISSFYFTVSSVADP